MKKIFSYLIVVLGILLIIGAYVYYSSETSINSQSKASINGNLWKIFSLLKNKCGDNICDAKEQANSKLCPKDCAQNSEELGTAILTLTPLNVIAGSQQRFEVTYTTQTPINKGGEIKIYFATPFLQLGGPFEAGMQNENENAAGYTEVSTSNPNVNLKLTTAVFGGPESWTRLGEAIIKVTDGALNTNDKVILVYGAGQEKAYTQEIAQDAEVTVLVSLGKGQEFNEIQNSPVLKIIPDVPYKLISAVNPDTNELKLSIVDIYANLVDSFIGLADIYLIDENNIETRIGDININKGRAVFQIPEQPNGYYIIKTTTKGFESKVPYTPGKQNVYFGDLHFHTRLSDSYVAIDPIDSYKYARDTALLDFLAVSDHSEATVKNEIYTQFLIRDIPNSWEETKNVNREFNSEGNFVTLLGFETTSGMEKYPRDGHANVYYNDYVGEIYPHGPGNAPNANYFSDTNELWEKIGDKEALTIQHHTLYSGAMGSDHYYYNTKYEKLIEIYSHHGCSLSSSCDYAVDSRRQNSNGSVYRAIGEVGYKFGFVGGSDNHFGHSSGTGLIDGKGRRSGGMTAVITNDLTKNSLWNAMNSKSTYATSGERIYLEFNINEVKMGSEISSAKAPTISARAIGTDKIISVEIIKYDNVNGWRTIYSAVPNNLFWNYEFVDQKFTVDSIYYLQVKQVAAPIGKVKDSIVVDEEYGSKGIYYQKIDRPSMESYLAWSSPIWVDKDSRCNWEPGLCKNICQSQNYYFDSNSKECKKYIESGTNKGCCTPPPFETLEQCNSVCK